MSTCASDKVPCCIFKLMIKIMKLLRTFRHEIILVFLLVLGSWNVGCSQVKSSHDALVESAQNAQKIMNRYALDSIADIMITMSEQSDNLNFKNYAFYFKCDALARTNPRKAIEYGLKSLNYFNTKKDNYKISRISNVLGHCFSNIGEHMKAVDYYSTAAASSLALKEATTETERKYQARLQYNTGFTYLRHGNIDKSSEYLNQALITANELKDSLVIMSVLTQHGNINIYRKNYKEALKDFRASLVLTKKIAPSILATPLLGIATVHQESGQADSALIYYDQVIAISRATNNVSRLCVALTNCSELYLDMGEVEQGITMANELMDTAVVLGIKQHKLNAAIALCRGHQLKGQSVKAKKIIISAISEIDDDVEYDLAMHVYRLASELEEQEGQDKAALRYHKLYKSFSDSLLNSESLAKVDELNIKFQSDQKDAHIQSLKSENQLAAMAYKQRMILLLSLMVGLFLLATIAYLFVNRKRILLLRQKENIERRLLRSQMNPHFIFNAISSIQNYLYDKSDLKVALNYMSKFAELMRQILENSREEYVPLHEEIKSLENYLDLQKLRYSNSFGYNITVDKELDVYQVLVPPLIAQPFVENAIEHGMIYRLENGLVKISFTNNNDKIELLIEDNGVGSKSIKIEPKKMTHKKNSLATIMTNERLQLLSKINKSKFEMAISSHKEGTLVSIQLPKIHVA